MPRFSSSRFRSNSACCRLSCSCTCDLRFSRRELPRDLRRLSMVGTKSKCATRLTYEQALRRRGLGATSCPGQGPPSGPWGSARPAGRGIGATGSRRAVIVVDVISRSSRCLPAVAASAVGWPRSINRFERVGATSSPAGTCGESAQSPRRLGRSCAAEMPHRLPQMRASAPWPPGANAPVTGAAARGALCAANGRGAGRAHPGSVGDSFPTGPHIQGRPSQRRAQTVSWRAARPPRGTAKVRAWAPAGSSRRRRREPCAGAQSRAGARGVASGPTRWR